MQFGPMPEKRPVPAFVRSQTQEELALKLLRQRQESEQTQAQSLRALEKRLDRMAEQLAVITHKKRFTEKDPLVLSLRQMLRREGIELVSYAGEPVTEELEEQADIVEWLSAADDPEDRVVDALEPEVRFMGRVLHRAKLSCRMGAQEPEEEAVHGDAPAPAEEAVHGDAPAPVESPALEPPASTAAAGPAPLPAPDPQNPVEDEEEEELMAVPWVDAPATASAKSAAQAHYVPKHAHGRKNTRKSLRKHKKRGNQRKK